MAILLIVLGLLVLILLMAQVYRILTLVSIAKGKTVQKPQSTFSNKLNAALFPITFVLGTIATIWYSNVASEFYLPEAASEHGVITDRMFWISMAIITAAFFVTNLLLFVFPYLYQFKENQKALFYPDNDKLEIVWTIVPAIVMAGLVISGWRVWSDITSPAPEEAIQIEIMGKQFNWQVRYAGRDGVLGKHNFRKIDATNSMGVDYTDRGSHDDFQPREIQIPKGYPIQLNIRARDVLHSVFMPHFRLKMDAVPGMPTKFWFVPTKTTAEMRQELGNPDFNYELACTEVCGSGHFAMRMVIVVSEPEEFHKWFEEQEPWLSRNPEYAAQLGIDFHGLAQTTSN